MRTNKLKRPKEPETSREEFIQAATRLFDQKGFFQTTVDDIVRVAKRSKGGFYHHFKSKEALFQKVFEKVLEDRILGTLEIIRDGASVREGMQAMTREILARPVSAVQLKRAAELYFVALHDKSALTLVKSFEKRIVLSFAEILETGKQRGELAFTLPALELTEMIYHGSRGIFFMEVILNRGKRTMERIASYLLYEIDQLKNTPPSVPGI